MNKKSVLIVCDLFPPAFGPRMGYLCKYLPLNGWNPVVITEKVDEKTFAFLAKDIDVTYISFYKKSGIKGKIAWMWVFLRDTLFSYKDRRMYREVLKITKKQRFDLILCSTYRTFPLRAAWLLSKKTKLPLIVDLRDILEQYTGNEFISHRLPTFLGLDKCIASHFRKKNMRIRNEVLRHAVAVTTVSPWHVSTLTPYNAETYLIYNGYDPELFFPSEVESDTFYITYTGRLLSVAMRDPDLLFQAIQRLAEEGMVSPDMLQVRWFVDRQSEKIIRGVVEKYPNIEAYMCYFDYVSASEIPAILNESAILLILTNKADTNGPQGVMTTKFFEALAVEKPILCVRGDEGCLEEVIHRTRSGLSAHNADEVYDFLKTRFICWKSHKPLDEPFDKEEIKKYSRESQAKQFVQLLENKICNYPSSS